MNDNFFFRVEKDGEVIRSQVFAPVVPSAYSDTIKASEKNGVVITDCFVVGGSEDAIDLVRGEDFSVVETTIAPTGKNGITLKQVDGFLFDGLLFTARGRDQEIELGQFCIYDKFPFLNRTKGGVLSNVRGWDNKPVRVRLWNADVPKLTACNVEIIKEPAVKVFLYFCLRRVQTIAQNLWRKISS